MGAEGRSPNAHPIPLTRTPTISVARNWVGLCKGWLDQDRWNSVSVDAQDFGPGNRDREEGEHFPRVFFAC